MHKLKIILASTRPGRKGPAIASWVFDKAKEHTDFDTELLDLAVINLPMMDEPEHPRFKKYQHEHTKKWSAIIDEADAFIFVMPEYNFGYTAPLKNAIDYLSHEWGYKPVGFVSYGGIAAGTRAVQMLKQVVTALKMVPLTEGVNIPFFSRHIDEAGKFKTDDTLEKFAEGLFKELLKWASVLKVMREKK